MGGGRLNDGGITVGRWAGGVAVGRSAVLMARPESLRLAEPGAGIVDGRVRMNVYLGSSVESFVDTPYGQVLVQTDDPASKRIFAEGSAVAITFEPGRVRLLPADA